MKLSESFAHPSSCLSVNNYLFDDSHGIQHFIIAFLVPQPLLLIILTQYSGYTIFSNIKVNKLGQLACKLTGLQFLALSASCFTSV